VDMKMDKIGVGGRHDGASQDPAAKCSRQEFGGLDYPANPRASAGPKQRGPESCAPRAGGGRVASHRSAETGDGWKIGIDGAAADWTLNRFSPETP
jgi:hypothetical protein